MQKCAVLYIGFEMNGDKFNYSEII